jgi:hypothetical protein
MRVRQDYSGKGVRKVVVVQGLSCSERESGASANDTLSPKTTAFTFARCSLRWARDTLIAYQHVGPNAESHM